MIYLIGVNHDIQIGNSRYLFQFKSLLFDLIQNFNIRCVFEEWSDEANKVWKINDSTIKKIVEEVERKLNIAIDHRYIDPNQNERKNEGIKKEEELIRQHGWGKIILSDKQKSIIENEKLEEERKREKIWLKKISDKIDNLDILFVCGTKHISDFNKIRGDGFDTLLTESGYKIEVIPKRFDEWFQP